MVKDDVEKVTWERLTERIQNMLKTWSSGFYLSWFDGMDYCVIRDYMELQDAAHCMMLEGDGSIRIYVSRDKREPSTVFGEKPRVTEQKTDRDEEIAEDREKEGESCTEAGSKEKDDTEKEEKEKNTNELESRMNKKKTEQMTIKEKKGESGRAESDSNFSDSDSGDNEEQNVGMKLVEVSESQKKNALEHVAPIDTVSSTPNDPTMIKPKPVFVPPTGEVQMIPAGHPVQPVLYAPYYFPNPNTPNVKFGINPWFQYQPSPVGNACFIFIQPNQTGPGTPNYVPISESHHDTEKDSTGDDKEANNGNDTNTDKKNGDKDDLRCTSMIPPSKHTQSKRQRYSNSSLQALRAMGFKQDEAHLKAIIEETNGDISKAIDLLEYNSRAKADDDSPSR